MGGSIPRDNKPQLGKDSVLDPEVRSQKSDCAESGGIEFDLSTQREQNSRFSGHKRLIRAGGTIIAVQPWKRLALEPEPVTSGHG
jgi:hypothetical protein